MALLLVDMLEVCVGGNILPLPGEGDADRLALAIRGIFDGAFRSREESEGRNDDDDEGACRISGEPTMEGRPDLGARVFPALTVDSLRFDWTDDR